MKLHLFFLAAILIGATAHSQDPEFTQFYANPIYLNPAFAGSEQCPRLILNYRNQWPGIENAFQTYSGSYDQYVDKLSGGLAVQMYKDGSGKGTFQTTAVSAAYSYYTRINKKLSLSAGVKAGFLQKSIDWEALTYGDMIDKNKGFVYETTEKAGVNSRSNVDFSAGAMIFSEKLFVGFAVNHLTQPKIGLTESDSKLRRRYTGHAGISFPFLGQSVSNLSLSPNILFTVQDNFKQLNLGLYAKKGYVTIGLWYRSNDAMIALVGIQTKQYKIGYSYDITLSQLYEKSAGAHEVSFTFQFPCRTKKVKYTGENCKAQVQPFGGKRKFNKISCPSF